MQLPPRPSPNPDLRAAGFYLRQLIATAINLNISGLNGGSGSQPAANAYAAYQAAGQDNAEIAFHFYFWYPAAGETITPPFL